MIKSAVGAALIKGGKGSKASSRRKGIRQEIHKLSYGAYEKELALEVLQERVFQNDVFPKHEQAPLKSAIRRYSSL